MSDTPEQQSGSSRNAAIIAMLFLCGVFAALRFGPASSDSADDGRTLSDTRSTAARPSAGAALGTLTLRNINGESVPVVTIGEPAVIMVSSRTCEWCKKTLSDLGELSAGRPLPRLKLITLEGASEGVAMVSSEKLSGVQLLGPDGDTDEVFLTFRYPGTPTLLAVNREGKVVQTVPGYPDRATLKRLYNVMVGDADVP